MMGAFVHTVMTRVPLELDVIKDRGALFKLTGLGRIENSYTLKIMNMSDRAHEFTVAVHGLEGLIITTPTEFRVDSGEVYSLPTSIEVDPTNMARTHYEIEFVVRAKDDLTLEARSDSRFLGSTE
jgi:polyferredoxin